MLKMNLTKLVTQNNNFKVSNVPLMDTDVVAVGTNFVLVCDKYGNLGKRKWDSVYAYGNLNNLYDLLGEQFCEVFNCTLVGDKNNLVFIDNDYKKYTKTQQVTISVLNYNDESIK